MGYIEDTLRANARELAILEGFVEGAFLSTPQAHHLAHILEDVQMHIQDIEKALNQDLYDKFTESLDKAVELLRKYKQLPCFDLLEDAGECIRKAYCILLDLANEC